MMDSTISLYLPTMLSVNSNAVTARMLRVCCTSSGWRCEGRRPRASEVGISQNAAHAWANPYRVYSIFQP